MPDGQMFAMGPCLVCRQVFVFDPYLVPAMPWPPPDGPNHPICKSCLTGRVNPARACYGNPPVVPLRGAYLEEDE